MAFGTAKAVALPSDLREYFDSQNRALLIYIDLNNRISVRRSLFDCLDRLLIFRSGLRIRCKFEPDGFLGKSVIRVSRRFEQFNQSIERKNHSASRFLSPCLRGERGFSAPKSYHFAPISPPIRVDPRESAGKKLVSRGCYISTNARLTLSSPD